MIFPIRMTGGKDKLRVNCGTPTIRSLVLSGLINSPSPGSSTAEGLSMFDSKGLSSWNAVN